VFQEFKSQDGRKADQISVSGSSDPKSNIGELREISFIE
jgi:hypothetical protein